MTCPDFFDDFVRLLEDEGLSLFLLAARAGVVDTVIERLAVAVPRLRVAGHHGYFEKSGPENDRVIELINQFRPDVLFIGFGMPLQERWIVDNRERLNATVMLPLGACLDFVSGATRRGPQWLTDHGFEWLTRMLTEPRRLWHRYLVGNGLFFYRVLRSSRRSTD